MLVLLKDVHRELSPRARLQSTRGVRFSAAQTDFALAGLPCCLHGTRVHLLAQRTSLHWMETRVFRCTAAGLALAVCITLAVWANMDGRRATTALLLVFGVTLTGGLLGVRMGLIAGFATSFIYNFFLSDPLFRLSLSSVDDLVPIIALNLSAVASGVVAGKLRDRADAAEQSNIRIHQLLQLSQDLQGAVSLDEMLAAARISLGRRIAVLDEDQIYLTACTTVDCISGTESQSASTRSKDDFVSMPIGTEPDKMGRVLVWTEPTDSHDDVRGFLAILSIAAERLALSDRLIQTDILRRSEEFKTTLLASVSHDLRTPLSAISASASSLRRYKDSLDDATQEDLVSNIEEQCDRLNRLTTNLLSLGRIEGGLDPAKMPLVDAVDALGSALGRARSAQGNRTIGKLIKIPTAMVRADAAMLEQLFYNVLENALVHTAEATPIFIAACEMNGHFCVTIEDQGPGIADADRERIFERFYQVVARRNGRTGSGLGLSISRGFARAIGGDVNVSSRGPELPGTRVTINLPLDSAV